MDFQEIARAAATAETVECEPRNYRGLTLGQVFNNWPDEVVSGRVAAGRSKSQSAKVARAYCKFAKAARELGEAVGEIPPAPVPQPRPSLGPTPLPLTRAIVPYVETAVGPTATDVQEHGETRRSDRRAPPPEYVQGLPHASNLFKPQLDERVRAWFVDKMGPQQPIANSGFGCRWLIWLLCLVLLIAIPKLVVRLIGLFIEKVVTLSVFAAWRVGTSAVSEAESPGGRLVAFIEDMLDVCITEPMGVTPAPPSTQAVATAAAAAAAQVLGPAATAAGADPSAIAQAVEASVTAALRQVQSPDVQRAATAPQTTADWRLPGWSLVVLGMFVPGFSQRFQAPTAASTWSY